MVSAVIVAKQPSVKLTALKKRLDLLYIHSLFLVDAVIGSDSGDVQQGDADNGEYCVDDGSGNARQLRHKSGFELAAQNNELYGVPDKVENDIGYAVDSGTNNGKGVLALFVACGFLLEKQEDRADEQTLDDGADKHVGNSVHIAVDYIKYDKSQGACNGRTDGTKTHDGKHNENVTEVEKGRAYGGRQRDTEHLYAQKYYRGKKCRYNKRSCGGFGLHFCAPLW